MMLSQKIQVYRWYIDWIQNHWHVERLSEEHCDYYLSINISHFQKNMICWCNKYTRWANQSNLERESQSKLLSDCNQYTNHNDMKLMMKLKSSEAFAKWWAENSMHCNSNVSFFHSNIDVAVWFLFIDFAICIYQSDLQDSVLQTSCFKWFFFAWWVTSTVFLLW